MRTFLVLIATLVSAASTGWAVTLFEDEFEEFELGQIWQEHAAGAPDVGLSVVDVDGSRFLQMRSSGAEEEFRGIELIEPISLVGLSDLIVDARLRPINQGVEGSIAAAEIAIIGQSGEFLRAFTSNNAGPEPESINDWGDHYEDSLGSFGSSGPWPHCDLACDAARTFVLEISDDGTIIRAFDELDDTDFPTWEAEFPDFTLDTLGSSFTIALRQLAVDGGDIVDGLFDYVVVSTSAVGTVGDFNNNGSLDAADIDELTVEAASGANSPSHDLNGDAQVNSGDITVWIKDLFGSWVGDANLDRQFNSSDLVEVLSSGTYEANVESIWTTGDFNGDGRTDSSDLVAALADGGYELGPRAAIAAVPEPASCLLLAAAGTLLGGRVRRRVIVRGRGA